MNKTSRLFIVTFLFAQYCGAAETTALVPAVATVGAYGAQAIEMGLASSAHATLSAVKIATDYSDKAFSAAAFATKNAAIIAVDNLYNAGVRVLAALPSAVTTTLVAGKDLAIQVGQTVVAHAANVTTACQHVAAVYPHTCATLGGAAFGSAYAYFLLKLANEGRNLNFRQKMAVAACAAYAGAVFLLAGHADLCRVE